MGFTEKSVIFLKENRRQNNKIWYQEHKDEYQKFLINPMIDLIEEIAPTIANIDSEIITEAKIDKTISRIYRDTRFSKDKSLYRDHIWCMFTKDRKTFESPPGFFFEFSHDMLRYGCGYYQSPTTHMARLKELILKKDKSFLIALKSYIEQDIFLIEGEVFKRSKYPNEPDNLRQWLERKEIFFVHNSLDLKLLFSDDLPKTLSDGFKILQPIYNFLCKGLS